MLELCRDDGLIYGQNSSVHRLRTHQVVWAVQAPCLQVTIIFSKSLWGKKVGV